MTPQPEEWRAVIGFERTHEVSDRGRVRSLARHTTHSDGKPRHLRAKILKFAKDGKHLRVTLGTADGGKARLVCRLVLESFDRPRSAALTPCHRDGDRRNNHIENLRWGTGDEARATLKSKVDPHGGCKLNRASVRAIRDALNLGDAKPEDIAKKFSVSRSMVSNIKTGRAWWWVTHTPHYVRPPFFESFMNVKGEIHDAFHVTADSLDGMVRTEWPPWLVEAARLGYVRTTKPQKLKLPLTIIVTRLGDCDVAAGDWIVRDRDGHLSRHEPESFGAHFDPVSTE